MLGLILTCEIGFWVAVVGGLALRYVGRRPRAGNAVLTSAVLIDAVLLVAVVRHLVAGGTATVGHALATFYLGFSLAYGRQLIAWADARFAHQVAGGPAPVRAHGWAYTRQCWRDVLRTGAAVTLAVGCAWAIRAIVDDAGRTAALAQVPGWALLVVGVELLWALSYTVFRRRPVAAS